MSTIFSEAYIKQKFKTLENIQKTSTTKLKEKQPKQQITEREYQKYKQILFDSKKLKKLKNDHNDKGSKTKQMAQQEIFENYQKLKNQKGKIITVGNKNQIPGQIISKSKSPLIKPNPYQQVQKPRTNYQQDQYQYYNDDKENISQNIMSASGVQQQQNQSLLRKATSTQSLFQHSNYQSPQSQKAYNQQSNQNFYDNNNNNNNMQQQLPGSYNQYQKMMNQQQQLENNNNNNNQSTYSEIPVNHTASNFMSPQQQNPNNKMMSYYEFEMQKLVQEENQKEQLIQQLQKEQQEKEQLQQQIQNQQRLLRQNYERNFQEQQENNNNNENDTTKQEKSSLLFTQELQSVLKKNDFDLKKLQKEQEQLQKEKQSLEDSVSVLQRKKSVIKKQRQSDQKKVFTLEKLGIQESKNPNPESLESFNKFEKDLDFESQWTLLNSQSQSNFQNDKSQEKNYLKIDYNKLINYDKEIIQQKKQPLQPLFQKSQYNLENTFKQMNKMSPIKQEENQNQNNNNSYSLSYSQTRIQKDTIPKLNYSYLLNNSQNNNNNNNQQNNQQKLEKTSNYQKELEIIQQQLSEERAHLSERNAQKEDNASPRVNRQTIDQLEEELEVLMKLQQAEKLKKEILESYTVKPPVSHKNEYTAQFLSQWEQTNNISQQQQQQQQQYQQQQYQQQQYQQEDEFQYQQQEKDQIDQENYYKQYQQFYEQQQQELEKEFQSEEGTINRNTKKQSLFEIQEEQELSIDTQRNQFSHQKSYPNSNQKIGYK